MHCNRCVAKVESALLPVPGVLSARATLSPPQVTVETAEPVTKAALDIALSTVGNYRLSPAETKKATDTEPNQPAETLYPLFLIVGYILAGAGILTLASSNASWHEGMRLFMAGFFLVFSFFKLLDIRGFANAYRSYDVVAKAWPTWAYIYPFVELGLGLLYLTNIGPTTTNLATLSLVGSVGVFRALLQKKRIRCACLGTVLNLPMTKVTLVEDVGMAAMAALSLLI
jgi:copper chaperone CopZ